MRGTMEKPYFENEFLKGRKPTRDVLREIPSENNISYKNLSKDDLLIKTSKRITYKIGH